jgi:hypothetical protein
LLPQELLLIFHLKVYAPAINPDTALFGNNGFAIVTPPGPAVCVHDPVPITGMFPARVVVVPQTLWSGPAFAVVAAAEIVTVIVSRVIVHAFRVIDHSKVEVPLLRPVTVVLFCEGDVIAAGVPVSCAQFPEPRPGELAAIVIVVLPEGKHWSGPARAGIGPTTAFVVTTTLSDEDPQAFAISHVKVYVVFDCMPLTTGVGE